MEVENIDLQLYIPPCIRNTARVSSLLKFPCGYPKIRQLYELHQSVIKFLSIESFAFVEFEFLLGNDKYNCAIHDISLENISLMRDLWLSLAGNHLVISAKKNLPDKFQYFGSEEEIIIHLLEKNKKLLLKTNDGYELLYLSYKINS